MRNSVIILLFTLMCELHVTSVHAQQGLRPRGDVNCDWTVNIADVNAIIGAIFNDTRYHSLYTYAYDINGDRTINISDLNAVIGAILGDELPPMPTFSGTLPVLFINTEGRQDIVGREKEDYLRAEWWLDNMGIEGYESIGSEEAPLGTLIKGHGNYTWRNYPKKSYRLKLDKKEPMTQKSWNRP